MVKPVWREVFLEIVLRALKKVHLSHTPWQLKKHDIDWDDLRKLNDGDGIFIALETTVASEISNEFIYSSFTNGMKIGDIKGKVNPYPRYYEIQREVSFKHKDEKNKLFYDLGDFMEKNKCEDSGDIKEITKADQRSNVIDLITRRWDYDKGSITPKYKPPALIELKRYNLFDFDISTGEINKQTKGAGKEDITNAIDIKRDIENLKILRENWKDVENTKEIGFIEDNHEDPFLYILTWGRYNGNNVVDLLVKSLGVAKDNITLKWMPLKLNDGSAGDMPSIDNWLWIAMIEIDPS